MMLKLLGLFAFMLMGYLWIRRYFHRPVSSHPPYATPYEKVLPENMVQCAHCGVHTLVHEAIHAGQRHYCCREHLDDAQR